MYEIIYRSLFSLILPLIFTVIVPSIFILKFNNHLLAPNSLFQELCWMWEYF